MVLLLAAILGSASPTLPERPTIQLDVGGLISSSWYTPMGRERIEQALKVARDSVFHGVRFDMTPMLYAMPVVGPWLTAGGLNDWLDRAMMVTCGALQVVGLSVGALRLLADAPSVEETGPVISLSPIAAGRLGLSVKVTGF